MTRWENNCRISNNNTFSANYIHICKNWNQCNLAVMELHMFHMNHVYVNNSQGYNLKLTLVRELCASLQLPEHWIKIWRYNKVFSQLIIVRLLLQLEQKDFLKGIRKGFETLKKDRLFISIVDHLDPNVYQFQNWSILDDNFSLSVNYNFFQLSGVLKFHKNNFFSANGSSRTKSKLNLISTIA